MEIGDLLKYSPTLTVGKVVDIIERGGIEWVKLDLTGLYYDSRFLVPAKLTEYAVISFKEHEMYDKGISLDDIKKETEEVDISEMMPSGGG